MWTVPTGFSGVPPVGPATPVMPRPHSAPSRPAPVAIASATGSAHGAVGGQQLGRHAQQCLLEVVGVGDHATQEDVAGAGDGDELARHQTPGARLGHRQAQASLPHEGEHDRGQGIVVTPVQVGAGRVRKRRVHLLQTRRRVRALGHQQQRHLTPGRPGSSRSRVRNGRRGA